VELRSWLSALGVGLADFAARLDHRLERHRTPARAKTARR
jgi:hypothetical protein